MIDIPHERAASAANFMASLKQRMETCMETGALPPPKNQPDRYSAFNRVVTMLERHGGSVQESCEMMGVTPTKFYSWCHDRGIKPKTIAANADFRLISEMVDLGNNYESIGKLMCKDPSTIRQIYLRGKTRTRELTR